MPSEFQESVQIDGYVFPDISTLTTSLLQEESLQTLCEHSVVAFKKVSDENRRLLTVDIPTTIY